MSTHEATSTTPSIQSPQGAIHRLEADFVDRTQKTCFDLGLIENAEYSTRGPRARYKNIDSLRQALGIVTTDPPYHLSNIAKLILDRPKFNLSLTLHELDLLADYKVPKDGYWKVARGIYGEEITLRDPIDDFLPALHWWWQVAGEVVRGAANEHCFLRDSFKPYSKKMISLLDDVMRAYAPAEKSSLLLDGGDECLMLLKRYRLYTRYIGELAEMIWPEVFWEPLTGLI